MAAAHARRLKHVALAYMSIPFMRLDRESQSPADTYPKITREIHVFSAYFPFNSWSRTPKILGVSGVFPDY